MKHMIMMVVATLMTTVSVQASSLNWTEANHVKMEPVRLTVPEIEPAKLAIPEMEPMILNAPVIVPAPDYRTLATDHMEKSLLAGGHKPWDKENWTWMNTNEGVKPYKVLDDLTFVGIPLFAAGWIIKGEKANFRQDYNNKHSNTRLITNFKTGIDDYTQFFGPTMTVGLKAFGYEGRSDWGRLLGSSLMSYAIMAGFVNGIKYTASEMRPDGSTANSWPSGHTATSFVGATILHKEYGMTRSPWFSVAGYGVATATGVMRILNNRHWISDVLSGAGIGIMSTELGYALGDLLFKGKGLLRNDLDNFSEKPSFFSISMGMSFGSKSLGFGYDDLANTEDVPVSNLTEDIYNDKIHIDFHTATSVDAEGAYFFNKYVGVGGRLRVRAMTAKGWSDFIYAAQEDREKTIDIISEMYNIFSPDPVTEERVDGFLDGIVSDEEITVESDHLTEFSANVGLYLNLPLNKYFSLGTKFLVGRTMTQELDINAAYKGTTKEMDTHVVFDNGYLTDLNLSNFRNGEKYDIEWDYLTLGGNNSTTFGTGLSLTYNYKSNFLWKVFVDYDYSRKTFTLTYDPMRFMKVTTPELSSIIESLAIPLNPMSFEREKKMHYFTIGGSFAITF